MSILLAGAITYLGLAWFGIDYVKGRSHQVRPLLICGTVVVLGFLISQVLHTLQVWLGRTS